MSDVLALMRAILGPGGSDAVARGLIDDSLLSEADPLAWVADTFDLPVVLVLQRAAAWAGLDHAEDLPEPASDRLAPLRMEVFAFARAFKHAGESGRRLIVAADFFAVMRLAKISRGGKGVLLAPAAAVRRHLAQAAADALIDRSRQHLTRVWPHAAAQLDLAGSIRVMFALIVAGLVMLFVGVPYLGIPALMPVWALVMLAPILVRLAALGMGSPIPLEAASDRAGDLPIYSVLVPLRDEAAVVDQLAAALLALDYPADRLDIIFAVEARSLDTLAAVRRRLRHPAMTLLIVPHALPLTKPKALNFALPFCRGEFVTVYDAEDRPDPAQLRQVVAQFRRMPNLHCIQAQLRIANGSRGVLPALFAGEYAGLFTVFLPALVRWGIVIPLGGTSNHFRLASLRAIGGWDAFNVTEDADLGVRLARRDLACGTTSAQTLEDAPETLAVWMGQRTRWMKGWMQTILVHNRRPGRLLADLGWRRFLAFEIIVLGMILAPLLHSGFLLCSLVLLALGGIPLPSLDLYSLTCTAVLVVGHGVAIAVNCVGLWRAGQKGLILWQALLPVYWLMIAWATVRALVELSVRPFFWAKTAHRPSREPIAPTDVTPTGRM